MSHPLFTPLTFVVLLGLVTQVFASATGTSPLRLLSAWFARPQFTATVSRAQIAPPVAGRWCAEGELVGGFCVLR